MIRIQIPSIFLLLLISIILSSCTGSSQDANTDQYDLNQIVAWHDQGQISLRALGEFASKQPKLTGLDSQAPQLTRYQNLIRRMVVNQALYEEAKLIGADKDPDFQFIQRDITRTTYSDYYLAEHSVATQVPDSNSLKAIYDQNPARFDLPEQRMVSHLYKAFELGNTEAVKSLLRTLQRRIRDGDNFQQLASQESDSDSRNRGGSLGLVSKGQLSQDFDEVVFNLALRTVSELVTTANGAHLFFVNEILPARQLTFEETKPVLQREWFEQSGTETLQSLAAKIQSPEDLSLPNRASLPELLRSNNNALVLFSLGDFSLSLGMFRHLLDIVRNQPGRQAARAQNLLGELVAREVIYQHIRTQSLPNENQENLDAQLKSQLIDHYQQKKLSARLSQSPEQVRQHYEDHLFRFSSPAKLRLKILTAPLNDDPDEQNSQLTEQIDALDQGLISLEQLAQQFNGNVLDTPLIPTNQFKQRNTKAAEFAALLKTGEYSVPFRDGNQFSILKLLEKTQPQPRSFNLIRQRVQQDYLLTNAASLYQAFSNELLQTLKLQIDQDVLSDWLTHQAVQ